MGNSEKLGQSVGTLLGVLLGSRIAKGGNTARSQRAQEIMNQVLASRGQPTVDVGQEEPQGFFDKLGNVLDPANIGRWAADVGPMPTGITDPTTAMTQISSLGLPKADLAAYASQLSDVKNRSAYDAISQMLSKNMGIDPTLFSGAGPEALGLGIAATKALTGRPDRIRLVTVKNAVTGLDEVKAVNIDALDPNSLAGGNAVTVPNTAGISRNAPIETNMTFDESGRPSMLTVGGAQDAAATGARADSLGDAKRRDRLRNTDIVTSQLLFNVEQLASAFNKGGPGGVPGLLATTLDYGVNSTQRTLDLAGINVPALDKLEQDPAFRQVVDLAGLKGAQKVAAYNLAKNIIAMGDSDGKDVSAREIAQTMELLSPVVSGGSPEVARSVLRQVVRSALQGRNAIAKSVGAEEYPLNPDIEAFLQDHSAHGDIPVATPEDVSKAKAAGGERFDRSKNMWVPIQ